MRSKYSLSLYLSFPDLFFRTLFSSIFIMDLQNFDVRINEEYPFQE